MRFAVKVTIRDSQIIKTLDFNKIAEHLQKTGWQETGKIYNNLGAVWRFENGFLGGEFEILLPFALLFCKTPET